MDSTGWDESLDQAQDERGVIARVREFVASLDYHEISEIPVDLRPGKFFVAGDVAGYALKLARHVADDPGPTLAAAHRFVAFFLHAHLRLSQVLARTNDPQGGAEKIA